MALDLVKPENVSAHNAARTEHSYPPIPEGCTLFQNGYGYEVPTSVEGWQWTTTFGKWSALVTFKDGWHGFTYPRYDHK